MGTRETWPPEDQLAWTPRQREVLALIARGHTNGEIAERLGVSLEGAKWHVREIMSKLNIDRREQAAEYWRTRRSRLAGMRSLTLPIVQLGTAAAVAGIAVGVAAVVAALVVILNSGGDTPSPGVPGDDATATRTPVATTTWTTTPTDPAAPTATPTREGVEALEVIEMTSPPPGAMLWTYQPAREGSLFDITRHTWLADGTVDSQRVFGHAGGTERESVLTGVAGAPDGSVIYAALCEPADCGMLVFELIEGMETTFYESGDGGDTWQELGSRPGKWGIWEYAAGTAVTRPFHDSVELLELPSLEPATAYWTSNAGELRRVEFQGEIAWLDSAPPGLVFGPGDPALQLELPGTGDRELEHFVEGPVSTFALGWTEPGAPRRSFVAVGQGETATAIFELQDIQVTNFVRFIDEGTVLASISHPGADGCPNAQGYAQPALLDLDAGTISFLDVPVIYDGGDCPFWINVAIGYTAP